VTLGLAADERATSISSLKSGITRNVASGIAYLPHSEYWHPAYFNLPIPD
jgi:hypothetical protein